MIDTELKHFLEEWFASNKLNRLHENYGGGKIFSNLPRIRPHELRQIHARYVLSTFFAEKKQSAQVYRQSSNCLIGNSAYLHYFSYVYLVLVFTFTCYKNGKFITYHLYCQAYLHFFSLFAQNISTT